MSAHATQTAPAARRHRSRFLRWLTVNLLLVLVLAGLPELTAAFLLRHPQWLDGEALRVFRQYYANHDRRIIQFLPQCAVYDAALTYLLRPPGCRVRNREHTVDYAVNSLGVRDDETSLDAPEVIVLGDSQAMGWGVAQSETFAERLQSASGRTVLNLAISSYGTVRELGLLARADRSRLSTLIIQYCQNDAPENLRFETDGDRLGISGRGTYRTTVEGHLAESRYRPWKHTRRLAQIWRHLEAEWAPPEGVEAHADDARAFLNALDAGTSDLDATRIIVFEINGFARNDAYFTGALRNAIARLPVESPWRRIEIVDLSMRLTPDLYYRLDDHLTAEGHRVVAEVLQPLLAARPPAPE